MQPHIGYDDTSVNSTAPAPEDDEDDGPLWDEMRDYPFEGDDEEDEDGE